MPNKGKKKPGRGAQGGTGGGRGGRGGGRGDRQPQGQPNIVQNQRHRKQKQKQRGGGGGGRGNGNQAAATAKARRRKGGGGQAPNDVLGGPPVQQVPEDALVRHQEIVRAHTDAVMAICMAGDAIYTASRDKSLKRWKPNRGADGRFTLANDLEVQIGDQCWCMVYVGDWLFCGLGSGVIKGYHQDGRNCQMQGHTKRVTSLLVHEHVLLSASLDNSVKCWIADPATGAFNCSNTISEGIPGGVQVMCPLGEHLWVGGTSGIAIVELASLKVVHQVQPKKFVAGLLQFQGHMIAAYADGALAIFEANGTSKLTLPSLPPGPILCVTGLESGPRLLVGHAKGQVSSITLPMFELKKFWQSLERCKVQCMCAAGSDGIFMVGAENGNLQVWQRDSSGDL